MKKLLIVFVAMLGLILAACNGQTKENTPEKPGETEQQAPAEISENAIEEAKTATTENMMFEEAAVEVDEKKKTVHLIMTVITDTITVDYAQETAEEFANLLASNYAKENESAEPLWNLYDLTMTIQTDKDNVLWEASKTKDSETINWK